MVPQTENADKIDAANLRRSYCLLSRYTVGLLTRLLLRPVLLRNVLMSLQRPQSDLFGDSTTPSTQIREELLWERNGVPGHSVCSAACGWTEVQGNRA